MVEPARFTTDGNTVVYSAWWDGRPPEVFTQRLDGSEAVSLGLPPARLLSVSSQGELAVLLTAPGESGLPAIGTLARVPLSGGAIRSVLDDVADADWSPDGRELAVVRWKDGQYQLEYPVGTVALRPAPPGMGSSFLRVSPRGDCVAIRAFENTKLLLVERNGRTTTVPVGLPLQGFAWAPGAESLLVTAGESSMRRTLHRVTLDGKVAEVYTMAGTLVLEDVARNGRLLIHRGFERIGVRAKAPGMPDEREVGVFAWSELGGVSTDGSQVLLTDHGRRVTGSAFLRPTTGAPAVHLGDGWGLGLSEDARWALIGFSEAELREGFRKLVLVPTGAGEPISVPTSQFERVVDAWHVSPEWLGLTASETGRPLRAFAVKLPSGEPKAVTPEGTQAIRGLQPDGSVLGLSPDGSLTVFPRTGGETRTFSNILHRAAGYTAPFPLRVSGDGRFLFVREGRVPARIVRIELATGRRTPWMAPMPGDPAGVVHIRAVLLTPGGEGYAYGYGRYLVDLYLVEGLRF